MSKTTTEIPFTEGVERVREIARIDPSNDKGRTRGSLNDAYCRELPHGFDYSFLLASSAITTDAQYKTGTVSVNTQDTACTFSTDVTVDATMTGRRIKFTNNPNVYTFTFSNSTAGTLSPPLSGKANVTNGSYVIYQPVYALAPDFDRFPKNGGLLYWSGGKPTVIPEEPLQDYFDDYQSSPSVPAACLLVESGTDGRQRVELRPPPQDPLVLNAEYIRRLDPLRDTTAGTCTVDAGSTSVTFHAGARLIEARTGYYFRVDAFGIGEDSEWYPLLAINQAGSTVTLRTAFGASGVTSANYTISAVPQIPAKLHLALLSRAVCAEKVDQDDPMYQFHLQRWTQAVQEAQRLYKTRTYPTHLESIAEDHEYRR